MENMESSIFDSLENERQRFVEASQVRRFGNFFIDSIAYYILDGVWSAYVPHNSIFYLEFEVGYSLPAGLVFLYIISSINMLVFSTIFEGLTGGRSPGKYLTGTRAIGKDGSHLTWRQAFKRSLARMVPFEVVSGLRNAPWHDSWTGTTVIDV